MSAANKKQAAPTAEQVPSAASSPLTATPIAHAYALVPDPARTGRFFAVHLTGVIAKGVEVLEPSGRSEAPGFGVMRMATSMQKRHAVKGWAK